MISESQTVPAPPSRRALAQASAIALLVAAVVLVAAVLPAEYGIDPLGTGRALGLLNLFGAGEAVAASALAPSANGPIRLQGGEYKIDSQEFLLTPGSSFEYKYEMAEGATMVYSWTATAPLDFDFHTEPAGKPAEASDSFHRATADKARGSYTAPYTGVHGWFWQNKTDGNVMIQLRSGGFYSAGKMYLGEGQVETMPVQDPPPPKPPF